MANRKFSAEIRSRLNATDAEIDAFIARLFRFLDGNLSKIVAEAGKGKSAPNAVRVLGRVDTILREVGLQDALSEIDKIYGPGLLAVRQHFARITDKEIFADSDVEVIRGLINFDASIVGTSVNRYVDNIRSAVMKGMIAGEVPDYFDLADKFGSAVASNIKTEIVTGTAGFNRTVSQMKAKELGVDLFLYDGPDDEVTRDFCQARVGKVFTQAEIDAWGDNDNDLPANIYLGGYNCRHELVPITKELAADMGIDIEGDDDNVQE